METNHDRSVAGKLFGTLRRSEPVGGFIPSAKVLREAHRNDPECAMAGFCEGCGFILRFTPFGVSDIAERLGVPVPAPAEDYFLQCDRCPRCSEGADDVRFRPLSEVAE